MAAVLVSPVMMDVAGAKEPRIAVRAAIRVLKQHMVKEPVFEAASFRPEELFAAAIGTPRDLGLGRFAHRKILCWGRLCYNGSWSNRKPSGAALKGSAI